METQWVEPTSAGWSFGEGSSCCVRRNTKGQRTISLWLLSFVDELPGEVAVGAYGILPQSVVITR